MNLVNVDVKVFDHQKLLELFESNDIHHSVIIDALNNLNYNVMITKHDIGLCSRPGRVKYPFSFMSCSVSHERTTDKDIP